MLATYISANQFSVAGNLTGEFTTGRRIKADCGVDGYQYSTIQSSSYSSNTTVTITESVLTSNLSDVLYGIINIGAEGSFPDHTHDGTEGQGGSLPYITESEFTTYSGVVQTQITTLSGVMQTQISSEPDTFIELSDTPSSYSNGLFAKSTDSGVVWATVSGGTSDVQTFLDLTDTPDTYSEHVGELLRVTNSGVEFIDLDLISDLSGLFELDEYGGLMPTSSSGLGLSFLDLTDTPSSYSDGLYAKSTTSGIEWATVSGGTSNIQTFLDLTDTPNEYSSGKFAQSTSDGIIWTTVSGGTGASYGELELSYSSNIVLDFTTYNLQSVILTGNTNFTFTNMTNGKPCILNIIQDATGSRSATFQSNIKWPQGVIPTTSSGSGLNDVFTFIQSRGTIYGDCVKAFQLGS